MVFISNLQERGIGYSHWSDAKFQPDLYKFVQQLGVSTIFDDFLGIFLAISCMGNQRIIMEYHYV
jgi:hypothetical protein